MYHSCCRYRPPIFLAIAHSPSISHLQKIRESSFFIHTIIVVKGEMNERKRHFVNYVVFISRFFFSFFSLLFFKFYYTTWLSHQRSAVSRAFINASNSSLFISSPKILLSLLCSIIRSSSNSGSLSDASLLDPITSCNVCPIFVTILVVANARSGFLAGARKHEQKLIFQIHSFLSNSVTFGSIFYQKI